MKTNNKQTKQQIKIEELQKQLTEQTKEKEIIYSAHTRLKVEHDNLQRAINDFLWAIRGSELVNKIIETHSIRAICYECKEEWYISNANKPTIVKDTNVICPNCISKGKYYENK